MKYITDIESFVKWRKNLKNKKIAFVPTMGSLHAGHLSLVDLAAKKADEIVVSIYVNPTQFNDENDFEKYPRDVEKDIDVLRNSLATAVFVPKDTDIYPEKYKQNETKIANNETPRFIDVLDDSFRLPGDLVNKMCGKFRLGHFNGVADVVYRLFSVVKPDIAVFGLKDFQQCKVIEYLVKSLGLGVDLVFGDIIREENGLALSSRNSRLNETEINQALALRKALLLVKDDFVEGIRLGESCDGENIGFADGAEFDSSVLTIENIKNSFNKAIIQAGLKPEYFEIVYADDLSCVNNSFLSKIPGEKCGNRYRPILLAAAVYCGKVRLIDNLLIK